MPFPNRKDPFKTRPISLLSCVAKTAEMIVLNRLEWQTGLPQDNIFGFTDGHRAPNSVDSLLAEINYQSAIVLFLDLEIAFKLASPTVISDVLSAKGVSGRLQRWMHDYLTEQSARVSF